MPPKKKPAPGVAVPKGHECSLLISSSVLGEEKLDLALLKDKGFVLASVEDDKVRITVTRIR